MNILIFGPNGSGKGTQGNLVKAKYNLAHIESGAIFREHIGGGTELGKKAKEYIDRGDLVPDDITIPMVLETLKTKGKDGWLLDGFPRNMVQAQKLWEALQAEGLKLDYVIEILLPREIAKNRIMGRRLCKENNNHPNNIFIDAIKPNGDKCRVCGGELHPFRRPGRSRHQQASRHLLQHRERHPGRGLLLQEPGRRRQDQVHRTERRRHHRLHQGDPDLPAELA